MPKNDFNSSSNKPVIATAHYVDISVNSNSHRFCEAGNSLDQYNSANVWILNLSTHIFRGKAFDPTGPSVPGGEIQYEDSNGNVIDGMDPTVTTKTTKLQDAT
jgi:hypothetical protein